MRLTRRGVMAGLSLAAFAGQARAQVKPLVLYDDGLQNDWQNWSWATVQLAAPAGSVKPIKVEGGPWSALLLHHAPISTAGFSKLTFYVNGGVDGGQTVMVKASVAGKLVEKPFVIQPKVKAWAVVEVPLREIGADNQTVDGFAWQAQAEGVKPYYVTKVQLE